MFDRCPGAAQIRTPTLEIRHCPRCGEEIEVFSNDRRGVCSACGFEILNDIQSCVQWCRYARECLGDEVYGRLTNTQPSGKDS
ncbi:MAG TPA: hypothetical protein PLI31_01760 [Methanoregulaceae archaeon]|nr:hypothetical protein [Methanoregulaceae archaeon]